MQPKSLSVTSQFQNSKPEFALNFRHPILLLDFQAYHTRIFSLHQIQTITLLESLFKLLQDTLSLSFINLSIDVSFPIDYSKLNAISALTMSPVISKKIFEQFAPALSLSMISSIFPTVI